MQVSSSNVHRNDNNTGNGNNDRVSPQNQSDTLSRKGLSDETLDGKKRRINDSQEQVGSAHQVKYVIKKKAF